MRQFTHLLLLAVLLLITGCGHAQKKIDQKRVEAFLLQKAPRNPSDPIYTASLDVFARLDDKTIFETRSLTVQWKETSASFAIACALARYLDGNGGIREWYDGKEWADFQFKTPIDALFEFRNGLLGLESRSVFVRSGYNKDKTRFLAFIHPKHPQEEDDNREDYILTFLKGPTGLWRLDKVYVYTPPEESR